MSLIGIIPALANKSNEQASKDSALLVKELIDCSSFTSFDKFYCEYKKVMSEVEKLIAENEILEEKLELKQTK